MLAGSLEILVEAAAVAKAVEESEKPVEVAAVKESTPEQAEMVKEGKSKLEAVLERQEEATKVVESE